MKKRNMLILVLGLLTACTAQQQKNNQTQTVKKEGVLTLEEYTVGRNLSDLEQATFAGGCFWCTEAAFERIQGVENVASGYSGGERERPTYQQVASGSTKHAEAIQVWYNPDIITYETLLDIFFTAHDPTQLNRQGPDVGYQYRSAIFYHNEKQKAAAEAAMEKLTAAGAFENEIVTQLNAYDTFWVAEAYHQDYYINHPGELYIQRVSKPKVEKVEKKFAGILKKEYRP